MDGQSSYLMKAMFWQWENQEVIMTLEECLCILGTVSTMLREVLILFLERMD